MSRNTLATPQRMYDMRCSCLEELYSDEEKAPPKVTNFVYTFLNEL